MALLNIRKPEKPADPGGDTSTEGTTHQPLKELIDETRSLIEKDINQATSKYNELMAEYKKLSASEKGEVYKECIKLHDEIQNKV